MTYDKAPPASHAMVPGEVDTMPGTGTYFLVCPECGRDSVVMNTQLPITFTCFCGVRWTVNNYGAGLSFWRRHREGEPNADTPAP